jgi:hypothetical protein
VSADIRYFQAAATIIPTMLVAIAFSARGFAPPRYPTLASSIALRKEIGPRQPGVPDDPQADFESDVVGFWMQTILLVVGLFILMVAAVHGEHVALETILYNEPTVARARSVQAAIAVEIGALAIAIPLPLFIAAVKRSLHRVAFAIGFMVVYVALFFLIVQLFALDPK